METQFHHLQKLVSDCKFPWILSNIVDTDTGKAPEGLQRFRIFKKSGLTIGVIGLVEEWVPEYSNLYKRIDYRDQGMDCNRILLAANLQISTHGGRRSRTLQVTTGSCG